MAGERGAIRRLQYPAREARVNTRWWWYGGAVEKREIRLQLEAMRDAGIGGVEIQFLYPLDFDDASAGQRHIDFFSPEFFDILDFTLTCAREMDIGVDLTLGSGWPFGGSFVEDTMAPDILVPLSHDVTGPTLFSFDYTCVLPGEIERVVLCRVRDGVPDAQTARDVTDCVQPTFIETWRWGSKLEVAIPEGPHRVFTFVVQKYKQNIGKPAPNMQGLAIDHCRKDVADFYFRTMGDALIARLGRGRIRSFFCDSIELGGCNWTEPLLSEFKARRGYDLAPYLPALWGDLGEVTKPVRYDYFKTFSELTLEGFFENFTAWCGAWGVTSRTQAHGIWADILKAYASADIPEGETFGLHDRYVVNTVHRRLAVSAGLCYDRPIVSNESFTWLRTPRFLETPEMVKRAFDAIMVDGIQMIVNHGFSYSPERAGKPGWNFYASSMLNPNNTWWRFYPELSAYMNRVCSLMQGGPAVSEVMVYIPAGDIWSDSPMAELHMALRVEDYVGKDTVNRLQRAGYWFTYVNDEVLCDRGTLEDGALRIGINRYRALLLIGCTRLPVETAQAIARMDGAGVAVIACGGLPADGCGLLHREENAEAVRRAMTSLRNARIVPDRRDGLIEALREVLEPDLVVEGGDAQDVGFIRRRVDGQDAYFIANISAKARRAVLTLRACGGVRLYDPMAELYMAPVSLTDSGGRARVEIDLEPNQSLVLIAGEEGLAPRPADVYRKVLRLNGWTLAVDKETVAEGLEDPVGWERYEKTRYHSGDGVYWADFELDRDRALFVELTRLDCCCDVLLDGETVSSIWKAPLRARLGIISKGAHRLTLRVVNTWINHVIDPNRPEREQENSVDARWPYFTNIIGDIRRRRLYAGKERAAIKEPQPSGVSGPVHLVTCGTEPPSGAKGSAAKLKAST
ncbi:glycosyl hydrolase [Bacillota bacterium Meth-B3]